MKKIIVFILLILLEFSKGYSQEQQKEPKPKVNLVSISGGFGYTGDIYNQVSYRINEFNSTIKTTPLLKLFYERNVTTVFNKCYIGIGLEMSQRRFNISANDDWIYFYNNTNNTYTAEVNILYIAPRVSLNYVFRNNPKWRTYCNVNLGLLKYNTTGTDTEGNNSYPYNRKGSAYRWQSYFGIRYFAFNSIGLFAEAGYGMSYINGGLNLRF